MDIVVLMKFVPDLVEELEIDAESHLLDRQFLRLMPNELDEHALEQALILKERSGGHITVMTLDTGDVDEALFTAVAKGADRVVKVTGDGFDQGMGSRGIAAILRRAISDIHFDLILTGTQAVDDLDGFVGAFLAAELGVPYVGYVIQVVTADGRVLARKEYPGGHMAEIEVRGPAVLGIQAAERAPRYVVTSKVMEAMKSARIDEVAADGAPVGLELRIASMSQPEGSARAEIFEGSVQQIAERFAQLLKEYGIPA